MNLWLGRLIAANFTCAHSFGWYQWVRICVCQLELNSVSAYFHCPWFRPLHTINSSQHSSEMPLAFLSSFGLVLSRAAYGGPNLVRHFLNPWRATAKHTGGRGSSSQHLGNTTMYAKVLKLWLGRLIAAALPVLALLTDTMEAWSSYMCLLVRA
jgi:hypothetical protein